MTKLQKFARRCYTNMAFKEYKENADEELIDVRIQIMKYFIWKE